MVETEVLAFAYTASVSTAPWCGVDMRPRRTLAIVGSHPKGREGIPYDDPNVDIMLFNEAPLRVEKYPRWSLALQIHGEDVYAQENNWVNPKYWGWLQEAHGKPIYMQTVDARVPDSVEYPLDAILGMIPYRYLRSSPAMGLALGIYLGYPEIQLYGSELTSNTEYTYQATNYAFWIGFAHGKGVDLKLNCWQDEFYEQGIYGYDGELQLPRDLFLRRFEEHEKVWKNNTKALSRNLDRLVDAMLANEYEEVGRLSLEVENAEQAAGESYACMSEAKRYAERENMISRQEYERTSAEAQKVGDQLRSKKDHAGGKCEYVWNVWKMTGQLQALSQLRTFLKEKQDFAYQCGLEFGKFRENLFYLAEFDKRLRSAGGVRALGRPAEAARK